MRKHWKVFAVSGIAVFALVCFAGGKVIADRAAAARLEEAKQQTEVTPDPAGTADMTPDGFVTALPTPAGTAGMVPDGFITALPAPESAAPASGGGKETITQDEDGNVTIIPDWKSKPAGTPPNAAPSANIGGSGGGKLDLDANGTYRGDQTGEEPPASTPKPTVAPAPAPTPPATAPVQPSNAPQMPPEPTTASSNPSGGSTLPPDDGTRYNGEISPDGKYGYCEGFGWVERGGGSYGIPGSTEGGTELSGEKVGSM